MKSLQLSSGRKMGFLHHQSDSSNNRTIVFAHGFPLDHSMWLGQLPLVSEASLLMPDLIGFGNSDAIGDDLTIKDMADDLADFLNHLKVSRVVFCGLSMGGYIGWEFLKHHSNLVSGLICSNTRATSDDEITGRARRVAASMVMQSGAGPVAEAMRMKLFAESTMTDKPDVVESVTKVIRETAPETIAAAQLAMSNRADFSGQIQHIDVPTLVVAGTEDVITPANDMQMMAMEIPGATFVELADSGHMSPLERPDAFNHAVVHWLNR